MWRFSFDVLVFVGKRLCCCVVVVLVFVELQPSDINHYRWGVSCKSLCSVKLVACIYIYMHVARLSVVRLAGVFPSNIFKAILETSVSNIFLYEGREPVHIGSISSPLFGF